VSGSAFCYKGRRGLLHGASATKVAATARWSTASATWGIRGCYMRASASATRAAVDAYTWPTTSATCRSGGCYMGDGLCYNRRRLLLHAASASATCWAAAATSATANATCRSSSCCYNRRRRLLQGLATTATSGGGGCYKRSVAMCTTQGWRCCMRRPWCYRRGRRFFQHGAAELTARGGIAAGATGGHSSETQLCRRGCKLVCGTKKNSFQSFFLHAGHH
jgi:hypothetical protein